VNLVSQPPAIILGIDTSCDDTGIGIVVAGQVVANAIASQLLHGRYGGVIPELASREHAEAIDSVLDAALAQAGLRLGQLEAIAATRGPGLAGALLVGWSYAKGLAFALNKPLWPIHHLEGHIQAALASEPSLEPPYLALVVSGGHTHLFDCAAAGHYTLVGATKDDAAGEAFDKVARLLGLGFPGGPAISRAAQHGDAKALSLALPLAGQAGFDFSFSGLKTAMLRVVQKNSDNQHYQPNDLAASFEHTVVESLVKTTLRAAISLGREVIVVSGGVAANGLLRSRFIAAATLLGKRVLFPPGGLNTDNGAMIALAGYVRAQSAALPPVRAEVFALGVEPYWPLVAANA
jgi:N6-L-threonylcarbamoyladenine synthase